MVFLIWVHILSISADTAPFGLNLQNLVPSRRSVALGPNWLVEVVDELSPKLQALDFREILFFWVISRL